MIRTILATAILSVGILAGTAQAQTRSDDQRAVATRDIDFNNPDKVRDLYGRIHAAAVSVCSSDISDPMTANADKACEASSVREAVAQIDQPQLTRLANNDDRSDDAQLASRDSDRRGTR